MTQLYGTLKTALFVFMLGLAFYPQSTFACKNSACQKHQKAHKHATNKTHKHATNKAHKHATNKLLRAYSAIRIALAMDSLKNAKQTSKHFARQAKSRVKGKLGRGMIVAAKRIQKSKTIANARLAFGGLSKQIIVYLTNNRKQARGVKVYFCPMAKGFKKWVQVQGKMANPYMGKRMLMCGSQVKL